jgi:hypothetical protein
MRRITDYLDWPMTEDIESVLTNLPWGKNTPGRDTRNFAHIGLNRLHSNSLKVYYCAA